MNCAQDTIGGGNMQLDTDAATQLAGISSKRNKNLRLVGVVAFLVALVVIGKVTGASEQVTVENLRSWMSDAGAWACSCSSWRSWPAS